MIAPANLPPPSRVYKDNFNVPVFMSRRPIKNVNDGTVSIKKSIKLVSKMKSVYSYNFFLNSSLQKSWVNSK